MKICYLLTISILFCISSARADQIELVFDVQMNWRYDLATGQTEASFSRPRFSVLANIDSSLVGATLIDQSTRIQFGPTSIDSPLASLVWMGFDTANLQRQSGVTTVQDTFINASNQGTWTLLNTWQPGVGGAIARWLQFTADPRLDDPMSFGSADLHALFVSHIGKSYGYREDSVVSGGGFQHNGTAVLSTVTVTSAIPEASTGLLATIGLGMVLLFRRHRTGA